MSHKLDSYNLCVPITYILGQVKIGFGNHLFLMAFILFVVVIGTIGIWFIPVYDNPKKEFWDAFDKIGMLTYCAPLLSVTIFDSCLRVIIATTQKNRTTPGDLYAWGTLLTILLVGLVTLCISNAPRDTFSWWAISSGGLSMFYWFIANADNDAYKKPIDLGASSGKGVDSSNMLMDGKNG
ncbi:hypothetical protein [Azotobacter salinestris]|uniref:hypothetical protein n=1 Tax=Azotobacter salinestris TaxID=69964 RepID=UPI0032DEE021